MYNIGDVVALIDQIDCESYELGTVKFIEPDDEIKGLNWIYVRANDESLNNKHDPRFGNYFDVAESDCIYLKLIK